MKISNWGNYPIIDADVKSFRSVSELQRLLADVESSIPRGMGRCYGDSALWHNIMSSLNFNRLLEFDEHEGILRCEAGVSLAEILDVFVSRGWFLPVTPGTKFVTVGGAIASDVHGKNHHKEGTFSSHLLSMDLMLPDGSTITCSRDENPIFFRSTCGGMGLTGIILRATIRLRKIETAYIVQKNIRAKNIDEIMDLFEKHESSTYSVAWIDCLSAGNSLGRSILMIGEHASLDDIKNTRSAYGPLVIKEKKKYNMPFNLPAFVLNHFTVKAFNTIFYAKSPRENDFIADYDSFFYPLDYIHNWNRIYGSRGFAQYQFVIPKDHASKGLKKILNKISWRNRGSFLAVLKLMGDSNDNMISFPLKGYTLALDFPIKPDLFSFLDELDRIVLEHGGRIYLSKDAGMGERMFKESYSRSEEFITFKHKIDEKNRFRSLQSLRLGV